MAATVMTSSARVYDRMVAPGMHDIVLIGVSIRVTAQGRFWIGTGGVFLKLKKRDTRRYAHRWWSTGSDCFSFTLLSEQVILKAAPDDSVRE